MCSCLWDCFECLCCCCCECAFNILVSILCSVFGLLIIAAIVVYFIYFREHSDLGEKASEAIEGNLPQGFRDFFKSIQ